MTNYRPLGPRVGLPLPDLSRLPPAERQRLDRPMPYRPHEVQGVVCVFTTTTTTHPAGRVNVAAYRPDAENQLVAHDGLLIDITDYSGKFPLASVVVSPDNAVSMLQGLLRAYQELGGDLTAIIPGLTPEKLANRPPALPGLAHVPAWMDEETPKD